MNRITLSILVSIIIGCSSSGPTGILNTTYETKSLPEKQLPEGWVLRKELLARWGTDLSQVTRTIPDSVPEVNYWESNYTTGNGTRVPIKRATVLYEYTNRLSINTIELQFVNIDYVYDISNHKSVDYVLERVVKKIELRDTGFPQLTAGDVIKHKILMVYGTPREFDGIWHRYQDENTEMKVRELDNRHIIIDLRSLAVEKKLQQALNDVYSDEGIEEKKQKLMEDFDL